MLVLFFRTIIIYFSLILFLRLTGKRQIGEMQVSELIIAFLLSELATAPLSDQKLPLSYAIIPIVVLVSLEVLLSFLVTKSVLLKRLLDGTPSILVHNGIPDQRELLRARISVEELLGQMRLKGIARLEEVAYAFLEHNGQISFLSTVRSRPPSAQDTGESVCESGTSHLLIVDGKVSHKALTLLKKDEAWLQALLRRRGVRIEEVFLCTADDADSVVLVRREKARVEGGKR